MLASQSDQIPRSFFRYLDIHFNGKLPNCIKKCPKQDKRFCEVVNEPTKIAKDLKFSQSGRMPTNLVTLFTSTLEILYYYDVL